MELPVSVTPAVESTPVEIGLELTVVIELSRVALLRLVATLVSDVAE